MSLYTTSITQAEILHGIRNALEAAAEAMFVEDFGSRILPFGSDAARPHARIAADRRRAGRPISQFAAQIAAIARATGAVTATRNVADYQRCGVSVVNPWDA